MKTPLPRGEEVLLVLETEVDLGNETVVESSLRVLSVELSAETGNWLGLVFAIETIESETSGSRKRRV